MDIDISIKRKIRRKNQLSGTSIFGRENKIQQINRMFSGLHPPIYFYGLGIPKPRSIIAADYYSNYLPIGSIFCIIELIQSDMAC